MAILASATWWVRAGGNILNGGGFDALISGAGTNYCDQDAAQLSLTDFATSGAGVTTLTSATGGFTAAMIGNCIRIASGTNFQAGYYFVTGYTNTNTVTLDRTPSSGGAGSGGTGRLGGAFATPWGNLSDGGTVTAPTITSPLSAGHTIWVRANGGSPDYDFVAKYATFSMVSSAAGGRIKVIGYNGRPKIAGSGIGFYNYAANSGWYFENLEMVANGTAFTDYGLINGATVHCFDVYVNQAGYDVTGIVASHFYGCYFYNTGSSSAGTKPAIEINTGTTQEGLVYGCIVNGWRGQAMVSSAGTYSSHVSLVRSVFANCKHASLAAVRIMSATAFSALYMMHILECAFVGNAYDGLGVHGNTTYDNQIAANIKVLNNIFYGNGRYGLNFTGSAALNARHSSAIGYNAYGANTTADRLNLTAVATDIALSADPFTDSANGDFSTNNTAGGGALLRGAAFSAF